MDAGRSGGAAGGENSDVEATAAPGRERRIVTGYQCDAVPRLLRGERLESMAREREVSAADRTGWRHALPDGGSMKSQSRSRAARGGTSDRPWLTIGGLTMDAGLLRGKNARREDGSAPFAAPRPRRREPAPRFRPAAAPSRPDAPTRAWETLPGSGHSGPPRSCSSPLDFRRTYNESWPVDRHCRRAPTQFRRDRMDAMSPAA